MSTSKTRKPLYFAQSYSARKCITKCPNCYNCKGHSKDPQPLQASVSPLKPKEKYPFFLEYQNGLYQGDLDNLSKETAGIFLSDDSLFYIGGWKFDQITGFGCIFFPKGGYLYAKFEKNKIHGVGVLNYPNGNRILGYWKRSKMHGPFMHYYAEKKLWVHCEYIEGLLMRYGKEEFSEDIPEILREYPEMRKFMESLNADDYLKGIKLPETASEEDIKFLKLTKELKYIGYTKKRTPHGLGLVFHKHVPVFYGVFKDGVLDGFGRMNLENGDIYEGLFKDGAFNGIGVYYNKKNDNYIYGTYQKNSCTNKIKVGSKYPLSLILNFKKEEHKKNVKFFNKTFNFSVLSLGPEFSDENFLEESQKSTSSLSRIYNFPMEKPTKKPLENIEVVHKSSSKDFKKTQVIDVKTHLTPQKRLFTEIELFQDVIHGKYYQFPRNCLDFYDNNIDSYEVISQNNNIYNLSGNIKRVLRRKREKNVENLILEVETFEDNLKINESMKKEENFIERKLNFGEKPNFLERTLRKEDGIGRTVKKSNYDKENLNEFEPKDNSQIIFLKKSVKSNQKMSSRAKNFLENDDNMSHHEHSENFKDVSRISSIRIAEKTEKSPEKSRFLQIKKNDDLNTDELNNLSDQVYLNMSKNRGIFDVSEDFGGKYRQDMVQVGQKFRGNDSFASSYSFVDKNKERNKSQNRIIKDADEDIVDRSF